MEVERIAFFQPRVCADVCNGWLLADELEEAVRKGGWKVYQKPAFGSVELAEALKRENEKEAVEEIELCGLCTDICVISNALLLKAFLPEASVCVDAACCAGVTPESHKNALEAMKMCQVLVKG